MRRRALGQLFAAVVISGLLCSAPVSGFEAAKPSPSSSPDTVSGFHQTGADNDTTVRHRNPGEVSEAGATRLVELWLLNALERRVTESAAHLRQGEYRQARALLGDEYERRLAQYVDIAGGDDDEVEDQFRDIKRSQRNVTAAVQEYEEMYDAYQQARVNGNTTDAHELASRLDSAASDVRQFNRSVQREYDRLENRSGASLDEPSQLVAELSRNISRRQSRVESDLFVETDLEITPYERRISYTTPLKGRGRLLTAEGDPMANRTITLQFHTRRITARTDDGGSFKFRYRPLTVPVDRSSITVRYVPDNASAYLGSATTVEVTIRQEIANLSATVEPERVSYGDTLVIRAALTVDGEPVVGVPINASIGGQRLEENPLLTGSNGTRAVTLPATVPPGSQPVEVTAGNESTAVTAPEASSSVAVATTATNVTIAREAVSPTELRLGGRLTTESGTPLEDERVTVTVGDEFEEAVRTGPDGAYDITTDRDRLDPGPEGNVSAVVRYNGTGRNLNSTLAAIRIQTGQGESAAGGPLASLQQSVPADGFAALGVGTLGLFVVTLVVLRRRATSATSADGVSPDAVFRDDDAVFPPTSPGPLSEPDGGHTEFDLGPGMESLLAGDEAAALQYTYQHLRAHVGDTVDVEREATHWEFFLACREEIADEARVESLRNLVEAYERVNFHESADTEVDVEELIQSIEDAWGSASP